MKCSKCGDEEFYKAYREREVGTKDDGVFLVCFKFRERYPLQGSEQKSEKAEG